jgi:hypothetical protein
MVMELMPIPQRGRMWKNEEKQDTAAGPELADQRTNVKAQ